MSQVTAAWKTANRQEPYNCIEQVKVHSQSGSILLNLFFFTTLLCEYHLFPGQQIDEQITPSLSDPELT